MTNQQILAIAMAQSAIDCNCNANDFIKEENVIVVSEKTTSQESIWNCHFPASWYRMVIIL